MDSAGFGDMVSGLFGGGGDGRTAGLLMAAGIALLTLVMLRRLWKRRSGQKKKAAGGERLSARERMARAGEATRPRETLEHLMVEVQELTRLCAAQMENRALRLEKLIREADEKIRRLEGLKGGGESRIAGGVEFGGRAFHARAVGGDTRVPEHAGGVSSLLVQDDVDPVTRRVYGLADQGLTPVEIAGKLEEQVGKVELILALRGH